MLTINVYEQDQEIEFIKDGHSIGRVPIDKYDAALSNSMGDLSSTTLPPAVRYIEPKRTGGLILMLEQPPQYHLVNYTYGKQEELAFDEDSDQSFFLPFPWMQYVINVSANSTIEEVLGFVSNGSFRAQDDVDGESTHYPVPMHNWYSNNKLCRPDYLNAPDNFGQTPTLIGLINQMYGEVWDSGFNNDLRDTIDNYYNSYTNMEERLKKLTIWGQSSNTPDEWSEFRKHNPALFYLEYYRAWEQLDLDGIMQCLFDNDRSLLLHSHMVGMSPGWGTPTLPWNALQTRILSAAMNAKFM